MCLSYLVNITAISILLTTVYQIPTKQIKTIDKTKTCNHFFTKFKEFPVKTSPLQGWEFVGKKKKALV